MIDLSRRIGGSAVETAFDILTLLTNRYTPKKMSETRFADFLVYVLAKKGYAVNDRYVKFTTKGFVLLLKN